MLLSLPIPEKELIIRVNYIIIINILLIILLNFIVIVDLLLLLLTHII